jgi:hypothetical protein
MLVAFLFVLELAVVGEMVVAIRGDHSPSWPGEHSIAEAASGPNLVDGGPHKTFAVGAHPSVTVDIGYADLTIRARPVPQIEVSVSKASDLGFLRTKSPITASNDGQTIRVANAWDQGMTSGDMRMVTILVPPETTVNVVSAGDVRANGLRGEASFDCSGNGSATIEDYSGPSLTVKANGRIRLRQIVTGQLDATSDEDRVEGSGLQVRNGTIDGNDSVSLGFANGTNTVVDAATKDGRIDLSGFATDSTTDAGHKSDDDDSSAKTVRIGSGGGSIDVHSDDGNITLLQES